VEAESTSEGHIPVLVLEDNGDAQFVYRQFLSKTKFRVIPAKSAAEARQIIERFQPQAIIMDVLLEAEDSWPFLQEIRRSPATHDLPVIMLSVQENESRAKALGASEFALKPVNRVWLLNRLESLTTPAAAPNILIVDDDEIARYLLRNVLAGVSAEIGEASNGIEALRIVSEKRPKLIFLDLVMPDLSGIEVLDKLRASSLRDIPVVLHTSKVLSEDEASDLRSKVLDLIPKSVTRDELNRRVRDALQKAGVSAEHLQEKA
jgi:CheY-like chemotaxis protein